MIVHTGMLGTDDDAVGGFQKFVGQFLIVERVARAVCAVLYAWYDGDDDDVSRFNGALVRRAKEIGELVTEVQLRVA